MVVTNQLNNSAIVRQAEETEQELVDRAKQAITNSAWTVGECASKWTQRYARGRTKYVLGWESRNYL